MSANIKTILIVGATSGLGREFARRFHALGKTVIAIGRRTERLDALKKELGSRIETFQWDITDLKSLSSTATEILKAHPDIDAVFQMSGIMQTFSLLDPSTSKEEDIILEVNTNVTAQALMARAFVPHLAEKAKTGTPATLIVVSSGLAYIPLSPFPVYNGTKSWVHAFALTLRQQIAGHSDGSVKNNLNVIELAPPYVATELDSHHPKDAAGKEPMPLEEYIDSAMVGFASTGEDGRPLKEIATGFSAMGVGQWRSSLGKTMEGMGLIC